MSDQHPTAEYTGKLSIGGLSFPCAVLNDGRRVLSETGVTHILGSRSGAAKRRKQAGSDGAPLLPLFISPKRLGPYISEELSRALTERISYQSQNGKLRYGVEATLIGDICKVWVNAHRAGALLPSQEQIARRAQVLLDGLVGVAIIALVDDATGFTVVRDRDELSRILEAYINKELLPWAKRFPDEYYKELFRLRNWRWSPISVARPILVGKLTDQLVYKKLPPGVLDELKRKNPKTETGRRKWHHHRLLTEDIGHPHLSRHLAAVTALMRAASNWHNFKRMFARAFPKQEGEQMVLGLDAEEEDDD